jgi:hypothetical protein
MPSKISQDLSHHHFLLLTNSKLDQQRANNASKQHDSLYSKLFNHRVNVAPEEVALKEDNTKKLAHLYCPSIILSNHNNNKYS